MKTLFLGLIAALLIFSGCNKCHDTDGSIVGAWKRTSYYGNESWGSPFDWHNGNDGTQVRFTDNGQYYRGEAKAGIALIGTYKLRGNIVEIMATNATEVTESFTYSIQNSELHLKYNRTESVVEELFDKK